MATVSAHDAPLGPGVAQRAQRLTMRWRFGVITEARETAVMTRLSMRIVSPDDPRNRA
jgi:hypothetical protein